MPVEPTPSATASSTVASDSATPVEIDDEVESAIGELASIAPLHNTPALRAIREARRALDGIPHVAVFDTAFHATIPDRASTYAIPAPGGEWGIRRYGFHGLSVEWVAGEVRVSRLVVCHLGGGCSVTAVLDGRSIDTTMGFTPLEGVPMATRSGASTPARCSTSSASGGSRPTSSTTHSSTSRACSASAARAIPATSSEHRRSTFTPTASRRPSGRWRWRSAASTHLRSRGASARARRDVRARVVGWLTFLGAFDVVVVPAREELVIAREVCRVLGG